MTDAVEKRKLRQEIGENFLEFADVYFAQSVEQILGERGDDTKRNCLVAKDRVFTDYLQEVPTERKFMTVRILKDKVKSYCKYRGLLFNPGDHKDGRVKFGTKEYIIVADNDFNMTDAPRID